MCVTQHRLPQHGSCFCLPPTWDYTVQLQESTHFDPGQLGKLRFLHYWILLPPETWETINISNELGINGILKPFDCLYYLYSWISCLATSSPKVSTNQQGLTISSTSFLTQLLKHYAKAFDKVDHQILLEIIHHYGIGGKVCDWIKQFLLNRTHPLVVNGFHSLIALVISGVPQGTVLDQ